jgi:hypothetical protein
MDNYEDVEFIIKDDELLLDEMLKEKETKTSS